MSAHRATPARSSGLLCVSLVIGEKLLQYAGWIGKEFPSHSVVLRLLVPHGGEASVVQEEYLRTRVGHEDRGVGGDDELRVAVDELTHSPQHSQLARRGQGRFGFVEDVEAIPTEAIEQERKKGLPVRLFVKRPSSVGLNNPRGGGRFGVHPFDVGRDVEKALSAEEEAVLGPLSGPYQSQVFVQLGVRGPRGKLKVDRPSLRVESPRGGDPFQQGGLAATVFTDNERDV